MFAFGEPLLKEGAMRGGLRGGDAAVVKAEGTGLGDEGGLELRGREMGDGRWKIGGQRRRWRAWALEEMKALDRSDRRYRTDLLDVMREFTATRAGWLVIHGAPAAGVARVKAGAEEEPGAGGWGLRLMRLAGVAIVPLWLPFNMARTAHLFGRWRGHRPEIWDPAQRFPTSAGGGG